MQLVNEYWKIVKKIKRMLGIFSPEYIYLYSQAILVILLASFHKPYFYENKNAKL